MLRRGPDKSLTPGTRWLDELDCDARKLRREVKRLREGDGEVDGAQEELDHVIKKMREFETELQDLSIAPVNHN